MKLKEPFFNTGFKPLSFGVSGVLKNCFKSCSSCDATGKIREEKREKPLVIYDNAIVNYIILLLSNGRFSLHPLCQ